MQDIKKYSQYEEQSHILGYFGTNKGRFLDIGAYDGLTFSNTRALLDIGWTGTLVEPDSYAFSGLIKNCGKLDGVELVNAAIASNPGIVRFFSSGGDALSTCDKSHCEKWKVANFTSVNVLAITPYQLLKTFPGPYDFVNLDVEGTNWEILQLLPLKEMETKLICVEYDNQLSQMKNLLSKLGFSNTYCVNGTNLIMGV